MLTLPIVLDAALKVTVLLAVAGLVTALMKKQSAAARHAVWSFAVLAALAIPGMEILLPSWRAEIFELPSASKTIAAPMVVADAPAVDGSITEAIRAAPAAEAPSRKENTARKANKIVSANPPARSASVVELENSAFTLPRLTSAQILFAVWMLGFLAALAPFAVGIIRVKAFARRSHPGLSTLWKETLDQLPASALPDRKVTYMESGETSMPLASGIFSPVVIVPCNAERWPAWKQRNILIHELAHVQRLDCLTQALATVLCAAYWFNPLTWVAAARMRIERELACDDRVLEAGSQPVDYADHLLEVARSLRPAAGTAMAAIAMARPSNLSNRLIAVLDTTRSRRGMSRRGAGVLGAASLILMLPLAAFKPWKSEAAEKTRLPATAQTNMQQPESPASEPVGQTGQPATYLSAGPGITNILAVVHDTTLALQPNAAPPIAIAPFSMATAMTVCSMKENSSSTHIHDDNDSGVRKLSLQFSSGDCTLEIVADGKFVFADDFSDVSAIAAGGSMWIKETNGGTSRRMEFHSNGGTITRKFLLNGVAAPFGDAERRWLADILIAVERRTAFSARTRVPRIFQGGGASGVLAEVSRMEGSSPKRIYLETLLDIGINLDGPTLAKMIRQAGVEMSSDYERRMILARMPSQKFMDDNAWNAFADVVSRMSSDYERRMVLTDAFSRGRQSTATAINLLNAAANIKSSYELGQVLTGSAIYFATNSASRPAYIKALKEIDSDYERRKVIVALVEQIGSAPGSAASLIETAGGINSDYEKSEVVRAFATRGGLGREALVSLVGIARGIKSDYEKHRSLSGIISSNPRPDTRGLSDILAVAASIKSDYELGSFLKEMIQQYPKSAIPRDAFELALSRIGSDFENNSVRAAMQRAETR